MRRAPRSVLSAATVGALTAGLLAVGVPGVSADGPSDSDVAASRSEVGKRERDVAAARAKLARTEAALEALNASAGAAAEAYNKAQLRLREAGQAEEAARLVLDTANAQVEAARVKLSSFAAASYKSGGTLGALTTLMTAQGPANLVYRASTLDAISRAQNDALGELDAAQAYERVIARRAAQVLAERRAAAQAAQDTRRTAQQQVDRQIGLLRSLQQQETQLEQLLSGARTRAARLEAQRAAALAAERAAAVARAEAARRAAEEAAAQPPAQSGGGSAPPPAPADPPPSAPPGPGGVVSAETQARAVQWARAQLGKDYQWGAEGPDTFDCSGLTMYVYGKVGVHLDHWTGYQWNDGVHVSRSELRPGDLVFFSKSTQDLTNTIHHMGIYIGDGYMIHAPQTGDVVKISPAFRSDYVGATRPYAD